jgi:hypothetical protein
MDDPDDLSPIDFGSGIKMIFFKYFLEINKNEGEKRLTK